MAKIKAKTGQTQKTTTSLKQEYYKAYEEHARTLKTWLVAYGVGALVLFMTQDKAWEKLAATPGTRTIAGLFIIGVAAQVLVSAINKVSMWTCYYGEGNRSFKNTRRYKTGYWISEQFGFDLAADVLTVVTFAIATFKIFSIFVGNGGVAPEWVD